MKKLLKTIKRIERCAYPEEMRELQDCATWSDVQQYCETEDVHCFSDGHTWYALVGIEDNTAELVDFAKTESAQATAVFSMLKQLLNLLKERSIEVLSMDCRESTSFPLLKVAARYGWVQQSCSSYWREGELFYEVRLTRIARGL